MRDEARDEQSVCEETAQQRGGHQAASRQDREITSRRPPLIDVFEIGSLDLQRLSERSNVEQFLEKNLLFEPRALASSELGIDEYELWADGLGDQDQPLRNYQAPRTLVQDALAAIPLVIPISPPT